MAVYGPQGEPLGDNVRFHRIEVLPHEGSDPSTGSGRSVPNPVRFNFGNRIALIGYALEGRAVGPGEEIHLTLYWEALAEMERDYTVFTHVIGERDRIWAQVDSQPQGGAAPTSTWSRGQVLMDEYHLLVEPDLASTTSKWDSIWQPRGSGWVFWMKRDIGWIVASC